MSVYTRNSRRKSILLQTMNLFTMGVILYGSRSSKKKGFCILLGFHTPWKIKEHQIITSSDMEILYLSSQNLEWPVNKLTKIDTLF